MSDFGTQYKIGNSLAYAAASLTLHLGAGLMLLDTALAQSASILANVVLMTLWSALAFCMVRDVRLAGVWRSAQAVDGMTVEPVPGAHGRRRWRLRRGAGHWSAPMSLRGGRVLGAVLWLTLVGDKGSREVICVPADAMDSEQFRRLRVDIKMALGA